MGLLDFLKKQNNQNKQISKSKDTEDSDIKSILNVKTKIINSSQDTDIIPDEMIIKGLKPKNVGSHPH